MPYRTAGGVELVAEVVVPPEGGGPHPGIVFFHGGGWRTRWPGMFRPQCRYLAGRGMVAASVSYRLVPSEAPGLEACTADAQAAVRWLRARPDVDSGRVVACGYSAGGQLAACTALAPVLERRRGSCRPDALVLINPALHLGRHPLSPDALVARRAPPTLVVQGNRDGMTPPLYARRFAAAMTAAGNVCELTELDGAHTFFHPRPKSMAGFATALARIDDFLVTRGILEPVEDVEERIRTVDVSTRDPRPRRAGGRGAGGGPA